MAPGLIYAVPLPGGVQAALRAANDPGPVDRGHFLLELIRRYHHAPRPVDPTVHGTLTTLLAHLERAAQETARGTLPVETVPLPLSPGTWIDAVFGGRATEETLVGAILRSRNAALLYHGLLSTDAETRAWLGARPALVRELAARSAVHFATAAPGIRVHDGAVHLPGGDAARPGWEALVGRAADDPEAFVRALVGPGQGRLAYFVAAASQLTPPQITLLLALDSPDPAERVAVARRLFAIFARVGWDWKVEERAFWRPPLDPAFLVAQLSTDDDGRPVLPGTRAFWQLAFSDPRHGLARATSDAGARAAAEAAPVDIAWLCEQVFDARSSPSELRYHLVLFASRVVRAVTPDTARDAIDAVRAAGAYPALSSALERAGVTDVAVFANAGRRAATLAGIGSRARARTTLSQFQGSVALLTRVAGRSAQPNEGITRALASLLAIEPSRRGEYEGRLVRWIEGYLRETAAAAGSQTHADLSLDDLLRRTLAGAFTMPVRTVDWEGTRYRVDLPHAELVRIDLLLGAQRRRPGAAASALVRLADALERAANGDVLREHAGLLQQIAEDAGWDRQAPRVVAAFERAVQTGDARAAARLAPDLRLAADDLLGQALLELTYAAAFGQPERVPISAREAAERHDFGESTSAWRRLAAWHAPAERHDAVSGWRVGGSLLGLDVRLAHFSVLQLSSTPPPQRPTLIDQDRRALMETIPLLRPASLADADRDTIVLAMRRGRARVAALRTLPDTTAITDRIGMSPARRSLLAWASIHDPDAVPRFLSASELMWLGLDAEGSPERLHAWGAPARPRNGCLCLSVIEPRAEEVFAGRWHAGLRVSGFPDLNLRLAELLAELQMPAPLLGPVLAPAILDFVNLVVTRDPDDRRGLIEFVQGLDIDRIEQYLAALTTGGPLVPIGDAPASPAAVGGGESEAPW